MEYPPHQEQELKESVGLVGQKGREMPPEEATPPLLQTLTPYPVEVMPTPMRLTDQLK